jgi:peptidoglycan/LPS O-acetylase OafA/YrhL
MADNREAAMAEFRRVLKWIIAVAVAMVAGSWVYLYSTGDLDANMLIATTLGVFFSVLLGCGLFAAAFFSDKSGHDQRSSDATRTHRDEHRNQD